MSGTATRSPLQIVSIPQRGSQIVFVYKYVLSWESRFEKSCGGSVASIMEKDIYLYSKLSMSQVTVLYTVPHDTTNRKKTYQHNTFIFINLKPCHRKSRCICFMQHLNEVSMPGSKYININLQGYWTTQMYSSIHQEENRMEKYVENTTK